MSIICILDYRQVYQDAMKNIPLIRLILPTLFALSITSLAASEEIPQFSLTIQNHRFQPIQVEVPAGVRFKLVVHNLDATPEEFESFSLNREKIIPGSSSAAIFIGPVKPGKYPFFGDFNQATANGVLIAVKQ